MKSACAIALTFFALTALNASASTLPSSPEGMRRTHVQNYKDLVLANCIANAYAYDVKVGMMP
ncbi:T6SS amidase immunity protein Tai4 family protein [Pseudomonas syringae group genomosp. 3]|uniref:T6SS amidase immunity protein Tai4 family protein n=1 Tax=Pseudomonas syringae group genomosp. 3 TaxID=251701 RepID=UPI000AF74C0E